MRRPKPFPGRSLTTESFWAAFHRLSRNEKRHAKEAHRLWLADTSHPSLRFKKVHRRRPIYSVRASLDSRAVGVVSNDGDMIWFWIGPHDEYEALLKGL